MSFKCQDRVIFNKEEGSIRGKRYGHVHSHDAGFFYDVQVIRKDSVVLFRDISESLLTKAQADEPKLEIPTERLVLVK